MPEQSVKQFRPDIMKNFLDAGIYPGNILYNRLFPNASDPWPEVMAYIERLENALDHIAVMIKANIIVSDIRGRDTGCFDHTSPPTWIFLLGAAQTFLEAVEMNRRKFEDD